MHNSAAMNRNFAAMLSQPNFQPCEVRMTLGSVVIDCRKMTRFRPGQAKVSGLFRERVASDTRENISGLAMFGRTVDRAGASLGDCRLASRF